MEAGRRLELDLRRHPLIAPLLGQEIRPMTDHAASAPTDDLSPITEAEPVDLDALTPVQDVTGNLLDRLDCGHYIGQHGKLTCAHVRQIEARIVRTERPGLVARLASRAIASLRRGGAR